MEWGGCLSPRGCPRCPWDSQGRESTVVNHPIQKLNLSTNLKKEFSNYVIFGMAQQSPWLRTYPVYSLCANSCCQPFYVTERQNEFFVRTSFCMHSTEFSYHFFVFSSQQPPSRERSCRGAFMWRMPRKVSCLGVSI